MKVCVYPCDGESVSRFEQLASENEIESVVFWRWDYLHEKPLDLIRAGVDKQPVDYAIHRQLGGVCQDVVMVHDATGKEIKELLAAFRSWQKRPILAIATPQSVNMSLAVLFEHLTYDRAHEERLHRRSAN